MIETAILLGGAVLIALPGFINRKKEAGRRALRAIVFVQGGLGLMLAAAALAWFATGLVDFAAAVKQSGPVPSLLFISSRLLAFIAGALAGGGLVLRLISLKASAEARERSEKMFYSLLEFQTAAGVFCLAALAVVILYAALIVPLLKI